MFMTNAERFTPETRTVLGITFYPPIWVCLPSMFLPLFRVNPTPLNRWLERMPRTQQEREREEKGGKMRARQGGNEKDIDELKI